MLHILFIFLALGCECLPVSGPVANTQTPKFLKNLGRQVGRWNLRGQEFGGIKKLGPKDLAQLRTGNWLVDFDYLQTHELVDAALLWRKLGHLNQGVVQFAMIDLGSEQGKQAGLKLGVASPAVRLFREGQVTVDLPNYKAQTMNFPTIMRFLQANGIELPNHLERRNEILRTIDTDNEPEQVKARVAAMREIKQRALNQKLPLHSSHLPADTGLAEDVDALQTEDVLQQEARDEVLV